MPLNAICDLLGVPASKFWSWRKRGDNWIDGNGEPEEDSVYGEFVLATRKAFATYQRGCIRRLHTDGNKDWVRIMTILERRDRANWGRNDPQGGVEDDRNPDDRFL
jgi:hypothetical protein